MRRLMWLWLIAAGSLGLGAQTAAADAYIHHVQEGETLASIARFYYGDADKEGVLVAENGLTAHGGAAIVVGMRLVIPFVSYHHVSAGETWQDLATRFLGSPRRAFVLIERNRGHSARPPDEGAEIMIPYPLRHVAGQKARLDRIAKLYYGSAENVGLLRRFNQLQGTRVRRGQIVLIPMADLVPTQEARTALSAEQPDVAEAGTARKIQRIIDEALPNLQTKLREGRYVNVVATANRLLGHNVATRSQIAALYQLLTVAYVALDHADLAKQALRSAIEYSPAGAVFDRRTTSPKVLGLLEEAHSDRPTK